MTAQDTPPPAPQHHNTPPPSPSDNTTPAPSPHRWWGVGALLERYYSRNLLFVRLIALLLIGYVATLVVITMRGPSGPPSPANIPHRFAKHIWGSPSAPNHHRSSSRSKKESGGAKAKGKAGKMGRRSAQRTRQQRGRISDLLGGSMGRVTSTGTKNHRHGGFGFGRQSLRTKRRRRFQLGFTGSGRGGGAHRSRLNLALHQHNAPSASSDGKPGKKDNKADKKSASAQVWQRTQSNTFVSKVSVGGGKHLVLKSVRVTVTVEGLRARTIVDHIYYNPHRRTLEGTFKYTIPPDASVSYYAMFVGRQRRRPRFFVGKGPTPQQIVHATPKALSGWMSKRDWGTLREARLVPAEKGRQVYEDITRVQIDPALLEQDAPNTFKGRVFPIRMRGYNRIIFAYEQTLPELRGQHVYRFRFPNDVADAIDFTLLTQPGQHTLAGHNARKGQCKPASHGMVRCYWEKKKPTREIVFALKPRRSDASWVAGTDPTTQKRYLFARLRLPTFASTQGYSAQHGVFLLDTSLSANPDLFAAHVALLQQILQRNKKRLRSFNVIIFDVGATWLQPKGWLPNTAASRRRLLAKLKRLVLEGATHGAAAFRALATPPWKETGKPNLDVFVLSDGQWNWGTTSVAAVLGRFRQKNPWGTVRMFAYRLGLGAENTSLLRQLVRGQGAVFSCLGRGELPRCATAHTRTSLRLKQVTIQGVGAHEILVEGRHTHLYPGGLVGVAARYTTDGKATVTLQGELAGKATRLTYTLPLDGDGDLAPRAWAEQAVDQLLALDDPKLNALIVAYAQHFRIPNPHCSYLVLETDQEYKRYGLEQQQTTHQANDLRRFLQRWRQQHTRRRSPRERWTTLLTRGLKRNKKLQSATGQHVLSLLRKLPRRDFVLPEITTQPLWTRRDVSAAYLRKRDKANNFDPITTEAKRRLKKSTLGAIRCLSSIVERHPGSPESLRLVGYYLMAWKHPAEAAQLFLRVLERRPFEPHSYRDVARALVKMKRYGLASALYEIVLSGSWNQRFGRIRTVAREEYALLLHQAQRTSHLPTRLRWKLLQRQGMLGLKIQRSRLRVTVTWNTDNTDIDLWVREPNGEKCSYRKRVTGNGGQLLDDVTQGYGPERYKIQDGTNGTYRIQLHYFGDNTNSLGKETHANVLIVLHAGTAQQRLIERNIVLKRGNQRLTVASLRL